MSIMSSHSTVPIWNLNHHQQLEAAPAGQLNNTYLYVNLHHNNNHILPLSSNYDEVAELTWQNGQAAMYGHSHGLAHGAAPTKPTWASFSDSLESIVHHHATLPCHNNNNNNEEMSQDLLQPNDQNSSRATAESGSSVRVPPTSAGMTKKRTRAVSDPYGGRILSSTQKETVRGDGVHTSVDVSASATLCGDDDTTLMTWASYESPSKSLMRTKTIDEDSACPRPYPHGRASEDHDDQTTKTGRSHNSSRRSRAAVVHNQSERRRRDRINQKMKALQRLVPNASKTDKASMLDEVIDYLKKLKSLLQMMGNARNNSMSQMNMMMNMMMPLQLARMGMGLGLGMGMGMLDVNTMAAATSRGAPLSLPHPLVHSASPFMVSPQAHLPSADPGGGDHRVNGVSSSANVPDPYCAFLAQSMNVESYNKMAAMLRQQVNMNNTQQATCRSRSRTSPSRQAGD